MTGPIQRIREQFSKRFPNLGKPKPVPGCLPNSELEELLIETRQHHPNFPVWERIEHPRDNYFSIYVMPMLLPIREILKAPTRDLKNQMIQDGIGPEQTRFQSRYEERFSHIWLAEMQRWSYRPIGICTFVHEKRASGDASPTNAPSFWQLSFVWLNPAQRNHHVLRNTVPYFEKWYPDFVVAQDHPIIRKSFKPHPQHLPVNKQTSMIWE